MADARWAEVRLERGSFSLRGFLGGSVRAGAKARHGVGRRQIDGIQIPARKRVLIVLLLVEISCVGLWLGVAMRERLRESSSIQESPRLLVEGMAMPPALRINERGWGRFWWAAEEGMARVPGPVWLADALAAGVMFMLVRRWSIGMDRAPASGRAWGERAWRWVLTDRSDPARVDGRRLPETPEAYPFQGVGRAMLAAMLVWFSLGAALAARNDPLGNWLTPMVLLAAWAGLAGRWFWCGVSAALACAVDSMALWPVAFFVLWPLCGNAPRAATRVIAGWGATTALIVSPWLVRSPLGMLWVAGVALVPVLLKKEWWGRGARKLEVPRSGFAKPQATLEPFARGESGAGGEGVVRQRRPFASTWIAIPVALELILWPLIMPSGQKLDALCAMVGLAILLIGLGRRMSGPWFRCQVAIAVAAGMFACPLLFAGSYKWADGARLGRAAEIVASLNIRQLAEAQFATPRGVIRSSGRSS